MTASENPAIDGALEPLRGVLTADGYGLEWSLTEANRIVIRVVAGADACADCLVPVQVMEAIMTDALDGTPYALDHVELPAS